MFRKPLQKKGSVIQVKQSGVRKLRNAFLSNYPKLSRNQIDVILAQNGGLQLQKLAGHVYAYYLDQVPVIFTRNLKGKEEELLPTLYTVHIAPQILPLITVASGLKRKICTKGDKLFMPGVLTENSPAPNISWVRHNFGRFEKGQAVLIREEDCWYPFAIGEWLIDNKDLEMRGKVGESIGILHHVDDSLWMEGHGRIPLEQPTIVDDAVHEHFEAAEQKRKQREEEENARKLEELITEAKNFVDNAAKLERKLSKQIRAITELEYQQSKGKELMKEEIKKINKRSEIEKELGNIPLKLEYYRNFLENPTLSSLRDEKSSAGDDTSVNADGDMRSVREADSHDPDAVCCVYTEIKPAQSCRKDSMSNNERHNSNNTEIFDINYSSASAIDKSAITMQATQSNDLETFGSFSQAAGVCTSSTSDDMILETRIKDLNIHEQVASDHDRKDDYIVCGLPPTNFQKTEQQDASENTSRSPDELARLSLYVAIKTTLASSLLPLLASTAMAQHVKPASSKLSAVPLNIKKTSWKQTKKFLTAMQDEGLLTLSEVVLGKMMIDSINYTHSHLMFDVEDVILEETPLDEGDNDASKGLLKGTSVPTVASDAKQKSAKQIQVQKLLSQGKIPNNMKISVVSKKYRGHMLVIATKWDRIGLSLDNEVLSRLRQLVSAAVSIDEVGKEKRLVFHCKLVKDAIAAMKDVWSLQDRHFSK
eukprot:gene4242-8492_t